MTAFNVRRRVRRRMQRLLLRLWHRGRLPAEVIIADDNVVLPPGWSRFPIRDGDVRDRW